jgi:3-dehydroquinate synthase
MHTLHITLPSPAPHTYPIHIGHGILQEISSIIKTLSPSPTAIAIITDHNLSHILPNLTALIPTTPHIITLPPGEPTKSLQELPHILSTLAAAHLDRRALILALGGGVIGDLAGFIAGIYLRGIRFIQIPTTLLAMVDSSVGGKTGVNLPEGKNLVGVFHQPTAVLADLDLLATLPPREIHAGFAEIIKYGVIADATLFQNIETGAPADLTPIITRSIQIKAEIVAQDERETTGHRALLNFGHTAGHAIEAITGYRTYLHGEAIALGMRVATHLSRLTLGLTEEEENRILRALAAHQLPLYDTALELDALIARLPNDKKAQAGQARWILSPAIGQSKIIDNIAPAHLHAALEQLHKPYPVGAQK